MIRDYDLTVYCPLEVMKQQTDDEIFGLMLNSNSRLVGVNVDHLGLGLE